MIEILSNSTLINWLDYFTTGLDSNQETKRKIKSLSFVCGRYSTWKGSRWSMKRSSFEISPLLYRIIECRQCPIFKLNFSFSPPLLIQSLLELRYQPKQGKLRMPKGDHRLTQGIRNPHDRTNNGRTMAELLWKHSLLLPPVTTRYCVVSSFEFLWRVIAS